MDNGKLIPVTDKVFGRLSEGKITLVFNGRAIGHVPIDENNIVLKDTNGFLLENFKIYKKDDGTPDKDHYADDCDLGWC